MTLGGWQRPSLGSMLNGPEVTYVPMLARLKLKEEGTEGGTKFGGRSMRRIIRRAWITRESRPRKVISPDRSSERGMDGKEGLVNRPAVRQDATRAPVGVCGGRRSSVSGCAKLTFSNPDLDQLCRTKHDWRLPPLIRSLVLHFGPRLVLFRFRDAPCK